MAKTRSSVVGNHCGVVAISLGQMRHLVPSSSSAYRSVSYGPCFAVELDEPNVTLTNYQVARMWTTRKDTPAPPCHYEAGGGGIKTSSGDCLSLAGDAASFGPFLQADLIACWSSRPGGSR